MAILYPTIRISKITEITGELLAAMKVKALILDVDNTLTTHNNPQPDQEVLRWLDEMHTIGIPLVILSNNTGTRVRLFAERLGLDYMANACKPLPVGFWRTVKRLGLKPRETAAVGDQIFTDILGGNLCGTKTILVEPMELEKGPLFKIKRKAEKVLLKHYREKERQP